MNAKPAAKTPAQLLRAAERKASDAFKALKRAERERSYADEDMDDDAFDALSAEIVKLRAASDAAYAERDRVQAESARA